jgi:hypothetical protein
MLQNATYIVLWPVAFQLPDLFQNTFMVACILIYCFCVFGAFVIVKGGSWITALSPEFRGWGGEVVKHQECGAGIDTHAAPHETEVTEILSRT